MKHVRGIWLPETEEHFTEHPNLGDKYPVLDAALKLVSRRKVACDVGAHIGLWSRWLVNEFKSVHAFEPVKEYGDIFCENVKSKSVFLHRLALGESHGRVSIKRYPSDTGKSHICGEGIIPLWPLDMFRIEADLIKIDVEGYELAVVKGGEETLLANKPIVVIEQRGCDVVNFGYERDEALKWLLSIGMRQADKIGCDYVLAW